MRFVVEQMAITLNNGFQMLITGLGLRRVEGKEIRNLIINPIKLGYHHFDCVGTSLPYSFLFLITFFFWVHGLIIIALKV
jgi:hypothetical protein